jgi:hypothetical protein
LVNVNDPLFTDLALKVIAGRASEAERSELAARVAGHPELEAELESLRADVAFAREVLPLLGDEQVKAGELPGYARARLHAAVKRSLGNPASPQPTSNANVVRMVLQWRWLLGLATAAAVALIVVSLNWPRLTGNTAGNVNSKPLVQLAMLDSMGQTRGTTFSGPTDAELAATLKDSLLQTNLMVFSATPDLQNWLEQWPDDRNLSVIKIWYSRDAREIRVQSRKNKVVLFEKVFPVAKEDDLPSVLKNVWLNLLR